MHMKTVDDILACIPVPAWAYERGSLRIVAANAAAVTEYGYPLEELRGMNMRALAPDEELRRYDEQVARGEHKLGLWRHRRKDQSILDVEVCASDFELDGRALRLGTATDVTNREARRFLELVETVAQSGGWSRSLTPPHAARWSAQMFRLFGLDPGMAPSLEALLTRVHPEDVASLRATIARRMAGEDVPPNEYRIIRGDDGAVRWIRNHVRAIRDDAGKATELVGACIDVTDERALSSALRAAEDRFAAVVASGLLGIVEWDGTRVVHANDAFLDIIGYSHEDVATGLDMPALLWPEHAAIHARAQQELMERGACTAHTLDYRRKDGGRAPVVTVAARLPGVTDGRRGVAFVVDDRQRREMQLRLAQADRLASMGAMAAAVAHELNNPLAYVVSNLTFLAESLAATAPGAELMPALDDARHGAERMRQIIRDLSTFSRVDDIVTAPVDLMRVLDNALALAQNEVRHRARVVKALAPVPPVRGNDARLTQVMVNLLINAALAMPEGEADRHTITISSALDGMGHVCLEVRDDGCGIAPDVLPHIFDPFFTTRPIGIGTGLGLSIAHRLVSAMDGTIEVHSQPGRGSTFTVRLHPAEPESLAASSSTSPSQPLPQPSKRARVVILDDEPMVGKAVKRMLAREHDVTLLTHPQELFDVLAREPIDVLLCDLMMPLMTGMDVFAEVQSRFPSLAPRVVFLTGGAFTPRAKSFLDEVPNPRLEKPFDADKLRAVIKTLLR